MGVVGGSFEAFSGILSDVSGDKVKGWRIKVRFLHILKFSTYYFLRPIISK